MTRKKRRDKAREGEPHAGGKRTARAAARALPAIPLWRVLAIAALTLAVYSPALSAPFVMDDVPAIVENTSIRPTAPRMSSFTPPRDLTVSGRPVVNATLAMNAMINAKLGIDPLAIPGPRTAVGFRLLNILIHLCTGALLFGVVRRAARSRAIPEDWRATAEPLAGTVTVLWLLHPLQTEAINYVVQRTELLASLFYVLTMYASLRAWDARDGRSRMIWFAVGVLACALGVGSKEIAISVPLAVILYDRAFRLSGWSAILKPGNGRGWFYLACTAASLLTFVILSAGARGDSAGFGTGISPFAYFYTQCWAIVHYLRLAVLPTSLTLDYGTKAITGAGGIPGLLLLPAFGIATLIAWVRVARWGWFAFAGTWFFMLLAPSSSFVPIPTEIAAERRIYLALAAVIVLAVVGAESLRRKFAPRAPVRRLWLAFGVIAIALAAGTAARSATYSDSEALWRDVVAKAPQNPRGYVNLGAALLREGPPKNGEAEQMFIHAMSLDSTCEFGCAQLARIRAGQGRLDEAVQLLDRAFTQHHGNAPMERSLALDLMKQGSFEAAVPHLAHLAANYPTDEHFVVLGIAQLSIGQHDQAIGTFRTAIQRNPQSAANRFMSGPLEAAGRAPEARPYLKHLAIDLAKGWQ